MKALELPQLTVEQIAALERLYRTTRDARVKIRAQMILLMAEQQLVSWQVAEIVRETDQTVRKWLKRYLAEGLEGLRDAPRPGMPPKVTPGYKALLLEVVRQRPRSLGLPFSLWTRQRLADYLAEETGIRIDMTSVGRHLRAAGIVLSRPQHKISSPDPEYVVKKRRLKKREMG
jgi:transposase